MSVAGFASCGAAAPLARLSDAAFVTGSCNPGTCRGDPDSTAAAIALVVVAQRSGQIYCEATDDEAIGRRRFEESNLSAVEIISI